MPGKVAGRGDRLVPVVDLDGALLAVVEVEIRPSHADGRSQFDEHVRRTSVSRSSKIEKSVARIRSKIVSNTGPFGMSESE
jgi:hypothetical protein